MFVNFLVIIIDKFEGIPFILERSNRTIDFQALHNSRIWKFEVLNSYIASIIKRLTKN